MVHHRRIRRARKAQGMTDAMPRHPHGSNLRAKRPAMRLQSLSLDKMNHFVDTLKSYCPVYAGSRGFRQGELSTK
jgi:hypothetical protein